MPELTGCALCGMDVNRHGLARHLVWDEIPHAFCSYLCEFFWRRTRLADADRSEAVSAMFPQY
ncbi:MAG TPA: hypothetical protein VNV38_01260 [Stellaceae bacterium]|nr:hypothetical protein [Stellaceae bacterium]